VTVRASRVLVVDDDDNTRFLARATLEQLGLEVIEAGTGPEALAAFDAQRTDLVLLDVGLPGLDGFEVAEHIRRSPAGAAVPILMLTGRDDVGSVSRAYSSGATDFASKPISWLVLGQRVLYVLQSARAQRSLSISEARLQEAQRIAQVGNWELDLETGSVAVSEEIVNLFRVVGGASAEDLIGLVHEEDADKFRADLRNVLAGRSDRIELHHRLTVGPEDVRDVYTNATIVSDGQSRILRGITQDISRQKRAEEQLRFEKYHDNLTGLRNQRAFRDLLSILVARSDRDGHGHAVLLLGLDRFKRINDSLGREAGDQALQVVADRLTSSIRRSDLVGRHSIAEDMLTVSRVGGDEFSILISEITAARDMARVAERLLACIHEPIDLEDKEIVLSASIGIAVGPGDGAAPSVLISNADAAMRDAKSRGGNGFSFYRTALNAAALDRLQLESDLRQAIEEKAVRIHYQPRISMASGAVVSAEALARWHHAERGAVSPGQFIPVSEEAGLTFELAELLIGEVCEQLGEWRESGYEPVPVSINASGNLLLDPRFPELLEDLLQKHNLSTELLEVEVTEGAIIRSEEEAAAALCELKRIGLRIALDDFGTGYSALAYLQRFPVDVVKIDRSFVAEITEGGGDEGAIVKGIVSMAKAMGLRVVAEGVETVAQREFLAALECDEEQGFLFSPAIPPREFERLLCLDGVVPHPCSGLESEGE
jgi:diguanylate cyclase (GGDEF)-like protein